MWEREAMSKGRKSCLKPFGLTLSPNLAIESPCVRLTVF